MVMIYFQDHHLLFTMRTDQRIIAKRRKDRSTPPVKTTESMPFFFRNSEMEFFINGTMSGIKAAITDHLEMFFRDVPDKAFDKIHDRNGFLNVLIIFVTIVMEGNEHAIIAVATFKNQAVSVLNVNQFKRHGGRAIHRILVTASRTETAVAAKRNELKFSAVWTAIHSATKRRITTVDHFFDIFHLRRSGMKSIFDFLIIVCKNSL